MNSFGKVVEILVTVVLLFMIPLFYMLCREDYMVQVYVQNQVIQFTDSVRNIGYVDRQMYEEFEKKINLSGYMYRIELSYYEKHSLEGISEEYYLGSYTDDILGVLYSEQSNTFFMHQGNTFSVKVVNQSQTYIQRIGSLIIGKGGNFKNSSIFYGGMIRSECF